MSPDLAETLARLAADLDAAGVRWALVGGLAVSAHTEPRFTRAVDVAVGVTGAAEAEAVAGALIRRGYVVAWELDQLQTDRLAGLRLVPPQGTQEGVVVDLLFASSGIEPELADEAEPLELVAGLTVAVARIGPLVALKVFARDDANRPHDAQDLRALLRAAGPAERTLASHAVEHVATRGFDRGKDLRRDLADLLGADDPAGS